MWESCEPIPVFHQRCLELNADALVGLCFYAIHMLPQIGWKHWRCKNAMGVAISYGFRQYWSLMSSQAPKNRFLRFEGVLRKTCDLVMRGYISTSKPHSWAINWGTQFFHILQITPYLLIAQVSLALQVKRNTHWTGSWRVQAPAWLHRSWIPLLISSSSVHLNLPSCEI